MSGPTLNRRNLIAGATGAGVGAVGALGVHHLAAADGQPVVGHQVHGQVYSPHDRHQAGIITPTPAATEVVALTLKESTDASALRRLLRMWSQDIVALMSGASAPGELVPEIAQGRCSLSVTVGFGPKVFQLPGIKGRAPQGFVEIPPMKHDRLQTKWSGGDLLLLIAADDATSVAFARRRLLVDAANFAAVRWIQAGHWRGADAEGRAVTGRNLFGQLDGTGNPGAELLEETVFGVTEPWAEGGTQLVVRRIEMKLDSWDGLSRSAQEQVVGRNLANGAPLTGKSEFDPMDFDATDHGQPVIALDAHSRLSHPDNNGGRRMLRRGINYTHEEWDGSRLVASSGLIFMAFQTSIADQFVPIQRRLDAGDALNEWTTAIGSAVFVVPGGFPPGSFVGAGLF